MTGPSRFESNDWTFDRSHLREAMGVQPHGETYIQFGDEIGDAVVLARIASILEELWARKVIPQPMETFDHLLPLIAQLPGVDVDLVRQALPHDFFPVGEIGIEDFLSKGQEAIQSYHAFEPRPKH